MCLIMFTFMFIHIHVSGNSASWFSTLFLVNIICIKIPMAFYPMCCKYFPALYFSYFFFKNDFFEGVQMTLSIVCLTECGQAVFFISQCLFLRIPRDLPNWF